VRDDGKTAVELKGAWFETFIGELEEGI